MLKLLYEESRLWFSFNIDLVGHPVVLHGLPTSAEAGVHRLFDRLIEEHGVVLVSHTLGMLTLSKTGLTVPEMEDVRH